MKDLKDSTFISLYRDYDTQFLALSHEQLGKLLHAVYDYEIRGKDTDFDSDGMLKIMFLGVKKDLDRQREWKQQKSEINRENGRKGGRPRKDKPQPTEVEDSEESEDMAAGGDEGDLLNHIEEKKPTGYESFDFSFVSDNMKDPFFQWLEYKLECRKKYRSQNSIQVAYGKLCTLSNNDADRATQIVNQSIANNWAGLFVLSSEKRKPNNAEDIRPQVRYDDWKR